MCRHRNKEVLLMASLLLSCHRSKVWLQRQEKFCKYHIYLYQDRNEQGFFFPELLSFFSCLLFCIGFRGLRSTWLDCSYKVWKSYLRWMCHVLLVGWQQALNQNPTNYWLRIRFFSRPIHISLRGILTAYSCLANAKRRWSEILFLMINMVSVIGLLLTFKPFSNMPSALRRS